MELKDEEVRGGRLWFVFAGAAAVILCLFLRMVDDKLTHSDREERLEATLKELRGAQFSIPSRATDPRQIRNPEQESNR